MAASALVTEQQAMPVVVFGEGPKPQLRIPGEQAQAEARERIAFYELRVKECVQTLEDEYDEADLSDNVWREVKLHYIGMLTDHRQPELAETFFNSVCCKILHRTYFNNDFIFFCIFIFILILIFMFIN